MPDYALIGTTYYGVAQSDPRDRLAVEMGDSKQAECYPQVKLLRWDNEANISVRFLGIAAQASAAPVIDSAVTFISSNVTARLYDRLDDGFEFELVLKEPPRDNQLVFSIQMKGLVAYYQPPLTEEDIKAGHVRPDRVVGSYAIYHEQPQATYVDGKNYRSGKAFHLYRPELIDANGQRTWAEQKLDTDAGTLTITMDREWLDRAVYPVVVDPTLGYTTQGGSFFGDPDYRDSSHATTGASGGTMSELHAFVKNGAATEYGIKVAVYTDDAGNNRPEDQVASEIEFRIPASSAVAERSGSYSGSLAASTKYWLAFIPEDISVQVAYDNSAANSECYLYPNPSGYDLPANWGNSGAGYTARYSIWAVYAAAGGRTTKNTRSHGLGLRLGLSRGMPQGVA